MRATAVVPGSNVQEVPVRKNQGVRAAVPGIKDQGVRVTVPGNQGVETPSYKNQGVRAAAAVPGSNVQGVSVHKNQGVNKASVQEAESSRTSNFAPNFETTNLSQCAQELVSAHATSDVATTSDARSKTGLESCSGNLGEKSVNIVSKS